MSQPTPVHAMHSAKATKPHTSTGFHAIDATLEVVEGLSCPRWHADSVECRCLCTWVGPGTLYVPNSFADRHRMAAPWPDDPDERRWLGVTDRFAVRQAGEWDLLLLKGHTAPGFHGALRLSWADTC